MRDIYGMYSVLSTIPLEGTEDTSTARGIMRSMAQ